MHLPHHIHPNQFTYITMKDYDLINPVSVILINVCSVGNFASDLEQLGVEFDVPSSKMATAKLEPKKKNDKKKKDAIEKTCKEKKKKKKKKKMIPVLKCRVLRNQE